MFDVTGRGAIDEINQATRRFATAMADVRLGKFMTPLNLASEQALTVDAWGAGEAREPRFEYVNPEPGLETRLLDAASDMRSKHELVAELVRVLTRTADLIGAIRRRDNQSITEITCADHGTPSKGLAEVAKRMLAEVARPPLERRAISAVRAAAVFAAALRSAGMPAWRVEVDGQTTARVSVRPADSLLIIRSGSWFSSNEVRRLHIHELGTHVARTMNGRTQVLELLALGVPGYSAAEEGLAAWHEQKYGLADAATLRRYALRALASCESLSKGFVDVFGLITEHTDPDEAFAIVHRAKRGLVDVRGGGAHVKDHVYLKGLVDVTNHLAAEPADYRLLLSGKVSLEWLPVLRQLDERELWHAPVFSPSDFLAVGDAGPDLGR